MTERPLPRPGGVSRQSLENIHRAFVEFLTIPTLVIASFLLLALIMLFVDARERPVSAWEGLFNDPQAIRDFLGVIAGGIITVTSMTFSLLLLAVQQGAAALTSLVMDQFLRRKVNQFYFGFFVGLALYSLIMLASVNPSHQPVFGVAVAGALTAAALYMLIFLIYSSINQMRPVVILKSIHDHTLLARHSQLDLLRQTRRAPKLRGEPSARVSANSSGFMARLDTEAISEAVGNSGAEVVILVSVGDYVSFGDPVAEIRAPAGQDMSALEPVIRKAVDVEEQRDIDGDPAFGIEQIVTIGWTSISSAKSNPDPGLLTIWSLRDLLARWLQTDGAFGTDADTMSDPAAPVVYSDNLPNEVMKGFESLVVVASESMQHQCAAECYRTFAGQFHRLPPPLQQRAADIVMRSLAGLGDHVPTSDLAASLTALSEVLTTHGQTQCARSITAALGQLDQTIGRLHSRSTRANTAGE
ncbi:MAG: DUF2254 domain-containing protein [Rhizobiales bacterium]|nr:DUF2254 domain-containing protein [Hyphomicrobiales bacterium]